MKTFYGAAAIRQAKAQAIHDIRMLRGEPPYSALNICYGDIYFAQSIKTRYKCDDIDKIWKWATS